MEKIYINFVFFLRFVSKLRARARPTNKRTDGQTGKIHNAVF